MTWGRWAAGVGLCLALNAGVVTLASGSAFAIGDGARCDLVREDRDGKPYIDQTGSSYYIDRTYSWADHDHACHNKQFSPTRPSR